MADSSGAWLICYLVITVFLKETSGQLNGPNRAQTIGNIFQIPIQTLTAISNVAQNTRPLPDVIQQRIMRKTMKHELLQQLFSQQQQPQQQQQFDTYPGQQRPNVFTFSSNSIYTSFPQYTNRMRYYSSKAAQTAGLSVASDGSGFRI